MCGLKRARRERGKGCGTLEYRTRKGWLARWTVDGKRFSRHIGKMPKADAEAVLADITAPYRVRDEIARAEMVQGRLDGARGRLKTLEDSRQFLLICDAFDAFAKSQERPDTAGAGRLECIRGHFSRLADFMRAHYPDIRELRHMTRSHAAAFAESDDMAGLRAGTFNMIVSDCKMVWRVLSGDELAHLDGENPFSRIRRRRKMELRRRELTYDELRRVCESTEGEMRTLFALGLYTGLRLGDCVNLRWCGIDLERRLISAVPSKTRASTGATVYVPMHRDLYALLSSVPISRRSGYLFGDGMRDDYRRQRMAYHIGRVFEKCGIETRTAEKVGNRRGCVVSFHSLRHTAVSMMANAGVPLAVVQAIVGHSNREMTRHYFHESAEALNNAICAMPCVLGAGEPESEAVAADGVLVAFREVAEKLDADGRRRARAILDELDGRTGGGISRTLPAPANG